MFNFGPFYCKSDILVVGHAFDVIVTSYIRFVNLILLVMERGNGGGGAV